MNRPDYRKQIENRIMTASANAVFITSDFLDIADTQAVNKVLSRLAEERIIRRVIRGVYDRPQFSELLQEYTAPDMEKIAEAIARNFGWTIIPCGDTALNILGLSTQVPAVWQYVSDGPYREYTIGNRVMRFKHSANRDVSGLSTKSALVVQALKALGRDGVEEDHLKRLSVLLDAEEKKALLEETQHGTAWINELLKELCRMEART